MNTPSFKVRALVASSGLFGLMLSAPSQAQWAPDVVCATPQTMIADQGYGDAYLAGINPNWTWSHHGHATSARGGWDHWPESEKARLPQYRGVYGDWSRLMPWFVISGPAGSYTPAHVELGRMSVHYFSRYSRRWKLLAKDIPAEIGTCRAWTALTDCSMTSAPAATAYSPNPLHGWFDFVRVPADVQAVTVSVQARSISGGRALLTVGADYYPPETVNLGGVAITAAGNSAPRFLKYGQWTTVSMTTLADQTSDNTGISRQELMRNHPVCANPRPR